MLSGFIPINPIHDVSVINQKPFKSEQTRPLAPFSFKNIETFKQTKNSKTAWLVKGSSQKQNRVSAKQVNPSFDFDFPAATINVNPFIDRSQYNTMNLLQDIRECLDVHTHIFLAHKQKQNMEVELDLKTAIQKVYKQVDIAIIIARENQEWSKQFASAKGAKGQELVGRLNEDKKKRLFWIKITRQKKTQPNGCKQLREHSRFPLSGIKKNIRNH